jgi:hypothetical protein
MVAVLILKVGLFKLKTDESEIVIKELDLSVIDFYCRHHSLHSVCFEIASINLYNHVYVHNTT